MIVRHYLDPFTEINAIRHQINDVFGELAGTATKTDWIPALSLIDQGNEYVLTATLAGVQAEDLNIQVSNDTVAISGERKALEIADGAKLLYNDIRQGRFHRVLNFPDGIQNNNVEADFSNGILTLRLPKVAEAQHKVVKVNVANLKDSKVPAIEANDTNDEV